LEDWLRHQRVLTIDVFLKALDSLKGYVPDVLSASTIALECRRSLNVASVRDTDVIAVAKGLAILVPDLVGVDGENITVNASAGRLAESVRVQLEQLHAD
jgi:hypothetical protein